VCRVFEGNECEPADSLRGKSNVIGGWLSPLTSSFSKQLKSQHNCAMVALAITAAGFNPLAARRSTSHGDGSPSVPPTGKVFQLPGAGGVDICGPGAVYKQRKVLVGRSKHRHMRPSLFTDGVWCGFLVKRAARAITGGTVYCGCRI
jgi:hypothetical protein